MLVNTNHSKVMSILNHFGKVKTTFVPYKSNHIYQPNTPQFNLTYSYAVHGQLEFQLKKNHETIIICGLHGAGQQLHDRLYGQKAHNGVLASVLTFFQNQGEELRNARYTTIQDFTEVVENIVKNMSSSVWKTLEIIPVLTLTQLLCLKVDDVDSRVDHLEKMLAQVIDDNKLLQRKVDALEQQKRLRESRDAKFKQVLIQELD